MDKKGDLELLLCSY